MFVICFKISHSVPEILLSKGIQFKVYIGESRLGKVFKKTDASNTETELILKLPWIQFY